MKRQDLFDKVAAVKSETQAALQLVYDSLNHGQQQNFSKMPMSKPCLTDTALFMSKG